MPEHQDSKNHLLTSESLAKWKAIREQKEKDGLLSHFNQDKLGVFVHWGLYSVPSGSWKGRPVWGLGEWHMYHASVSREDYAGLAKGLNTEAFDPDEWVGLVKNSGFNYMVVTAKHHDGFALWDSECSDFTLAKSVEGRRMVLDELYDACQKAGIGFGLYYSHVIDWRDGWEGEGGYFEYDATKRDREKDNPMNTWDPPNMSRRDYFEKKAFPQLEELLVRFPKLYSLWFDYWYKDKYLQPEEAFRFYELVHTHQPNCLVNSRLDGQEGPDTLGDYITCGDDMIPEPGQTMAWETPATLNNTWGYSEHHREWKSELELLHFLINILSRGGNLLLNIGPRPDGSLPTETFTCFGHLTRWLKVNGEAAYGTKMWRIDKEGQSQGDFGGTLSREEGGFNAKLSAQDLWFTTKENLIYVIGLVWPEDGTVCIKSLRDSTCEEISLLGSEESLSWSQDSEGLKVVLPTIDLPTIGFVLKIIT